MRRKFNYISDNFPLIVFTFTYIISVLSFYGVFLNISHNTEFIIKVLGSFIFLFGGIFLWAFLIILFRFPQQMAGAFDPLKNKIASGIISNQEEFASHITTFLKEFFNYTFFDVEYSAFKTDKQKPVFSDKLISSWIDWEKTDTIAGKNPDIIFHGKIKNDRHKIYAYSTPVYFGDLYLGYFTVFTRQKLGKLRQKFLAELEENFIDDQLFHIMSKK